MFMIKKKKILTIDLEDWFHPLEPNSNRWDSFERRIEKPALELLKLFKKYNAYATFFVLGDIAKNHPDLIKEIAVNGHDIGSHSIYHKMIYNQSPKEFENEIKTSIDMLNSITGKEVISFRAPYFSITKKSLWALDILKNAGIKIDSSIFPVHNHRYGIPDAIRNPHEIIKGLWEYPISTFSLANFNIPFSGGVYFRFLPINITLKMTKKIESKDELFIFYLHPWECDPMQPVIKSYSWFLNFRHYYALDKTLSKLEILLQKNEFVSLEYYHNNYMNING